MPWVLEVLSFSSAYFEVQFYNSQVWTDFYLAEIFDNNFSIGEHFIWYFI